MRVLLCPPTFKYKTEYPAFLSLSDFPTGFAYLAAALKQAGHEVYGCNPNNITGYVDAPTMLKAVLTKRIAEVTPELIGLGGLCTDYKFLKDAIGIIRGIDPKIPIVLGGQIVTNDAEDVFNLLKPDYVVKGEGEQAMLDLASRRLHENGTLDVRTSEGKPLPIDSISFPDYEPFGIQDMMDSYSGATRLLYRYSRQNPRVYGIVTARGCPFACTFCIDHHRNYRERSIKNIMEEIKVTYEKYRFNILLILDELFAINTQRMNDFCMGVLAGKEKYGWDFDWCFQTHANARLNLESLYLAKKAGCFSFSYGLESASPAVLKSMNKHIKIPQVIEALNLAKKARIGFSANLIFGDIAETAETISESLSFWLNYCSQSFVFLSNVMPYPGSALFETCRGRGMFQNKLEYYENIDKNPLNLTAISEREYRGLTELIRFLEQSWLFAKTAQVTKTERLPDEDLYLKKMGGFYYKITAICPYCGKEIQYKERLGDIRQPFWLGTGCTMCNSKIKVVSA